MGVVAGFSTTRGDYDDLPTVHFVVAGVALPPRAWCVFPSSCLSIYRTREFLSKLVARLIRRRRRASHRAAIFRLPCSRGVPEFALAGSSRRFPPLFVDGVERARGVRPPVAIRIEKFVVAVDRVLLSK